MKEHEQQVYEEKVRFLININHELRTPLTLIHAPLKQLLKSLSPEDDKYPVIQSISKQSGRMKNLLNMVLDVRKMEVGQSTLHAETVELAHFSLFSLRRNREKNASMMPETINMKHTLINQMDLYHGGNTTSSRI